MRKKKVFRIAPDRTETEVDAEEIEAGDMVRIEGSGATYRIRVAPRLTPGYWEVEQSPVRFPPLPEELTIVGTFLSENP